MVNDLIKATRNTMEADEVLVEAFKEFTKLQSLVSYISPPEMVEILIDLTQHHPSMK
jgi:hypothetical protein